MGKRLADVQVKSWAGLCKTSFGGALDPRNLRLYGYDNIPVFVTSIEGRLAGVRDVFGAGTIVLASLLQPYNGLFTVRDLDTGRMAGFKETGVIFETGQQALDVIKSYRLDHSWRVVPLGE